MFLGVMKRSEEQVVAINNLVGEKCVLWSPRQTVGAGVEAK